MKELWDEYQKLSLESISIIRAGIDDAMTKEIYERDRFVFNRKKELESIIFPQLNERKTLTFNHAPRNAYWESCDDLQFSGWICVDNKMTSDDFPGEYVSGYIVFAKKPF